MHYTQVNTVHVMKQIFSTETTFYPDVKKFTKQIKVFSHIAPEISRVLLVLCLNHSLELTAFYRLLFLP